MLVKGAGLPFRASDMDQLRPFQRRFVKGANRPGHRYRGTVVAQGEREIVAGCLLVGAGIVAG